MKRACLVAILLSGCHCAGSEDVSGKYLLAPYSPLSKDEVMKLERQAGTGDINAIKKLQAYYLGRGKEDEALRVTKIGADLKVPAFMWTYADELCRRKDPQLRAQGAELMRNMRQNYVVENVGADDCDDLIGPP